MCDLGCEEDILINLEELGELADVLWGGTGLSIEDCSGGDFLTSECFCDCLEGEVLCLLRGEEKGAV